MIPSAPVLAAYVRESLPLVFTMLVVFVDLAPRPAPGGGGVAPFFTLVAVYFWCVYRPDLMGNVPVFVVGLVYDLLSGLPLGGTSFALVVGRSMLVAGHRFFRAKSFTVIWALFLLWAPGVELIRYLVMAAILGVVVDPSPLLIQCVLTIALYPTLSWFLVRLHELVRTTAHAES